MTSYIDDKISIVEISNLTSEKMRKNKINKQKDIQTEKSCSGIGSSPAGGTSSSISAPISCKALRQQTKHPEDRWLLGHDRTEKYIRYMPT